LGRRSRRDKPEHLRQALIELFRKFESDLLQNDLRSQVQALIPAFHNLRDLGASLIDQVDADSGRDRILFYFLKYPRTIIPGEELMVVGGIDDWARRVRELRTEAGWAIATGVTLREMLDESDVDASDFAATNLSVDDYVLLTEVQDRDAAHRWHLANTSRGKVEGVRDRILTYLRANVGKPVTGEELRYVAKGKTEWARRVRELRTEEGWPIVTKTTGRPDLGIGVYLLEADRQMPAHDRRIPDDLRMKVLQRDHFRCQECDWSQKYWEKTDPRNHLELHHKQHVAYGGKNSLENLVTLCNVCHDRKHS
jgi:hypothetical protein